MRNLWEKIIRRIGYTIAIFIILAGLLVSVGRLMTPFLNDHLPDFETWSSTLLNAPVKIKHVQIYWNAYEPEIAFDNVVVLNKETHQAQFSIQQINVNLNIIRSLITRRPITDSIKVAGVHLTIQQPASGQFLVKELANLGVTDNATGAATNVSDALAWLFAESSLILEDIHIDYQYLSKQQKSILIERLVLKNNATQHELFGRALLNQDIPIRIKTNVTWTGTIVDLQNLPADLSANLYFYIEGFSVPQWLGGYSWHNLRLKQGLGSAKIWATFDKNIFQKIQSQFQFYDLQVVSSVTQQTQEISRISGHVGWKRDGEKQIFVGNDLLIDLKEHLWPATSFAVTIAPTADHASFNVENVQVSYLNLADMQQIALATGLIPKDVEKTLANLNATGELRGFEIGFPAGPTLDPEHMQLKVQFSNLSFNAWQTYPSVKNFSGLFGWDGKQGQMRIDSQQLEVKYPSVFANPLQLAQLGATLHVQKQQADGAWLVDSMNFQAINADLSAQGAMTLKIPKNDSPVIDLSSDFTLKNAGHISNYLPLSIFDAELVHWLHNAFFNGKVTSGHAILQGRLSDFPYEQGNGKFLISGQVNDVDLNYAPGWPLLKHISGRLVFSDASMTADITAAKLLDVNVSTVHATIPYLGNREPQILHVQGSMQADLKQALAYVYQSPLKNTLGKDLSGLQMSGPMQLQLGLVIPLKNPDATTVVGDMVMTNSTVNLPLEDLKIEQIKGPLHFTEHDIAAPNLQAQVLGEPATVVLSMQKDKNNIPYLKTMLQSTIKMETLQKMVKMPLGQYMQGVTAYQAEAHLPGHDKVQPLQVIITSDLKGIAVNLPDPYSKPANTTVPLQLNLLVSKSKPILLNVKYGNDLAAIMSYENSARGLSFNRGELRLGGGAPALPSQSGLIITAQFKQLSWDMLKPYMTWANAQMNKSITGKTDDGMESIFRAINLQADTADFFGQRLDDARIQVEKLSAGWNINVASTQVNGQLMLANHFSSIQGKFQNFYVVSSGMATEQTVDPKSLPALSIVAENVRYSEKQIGSVTLQTAPSVAGMQITQLQLKSPAATLEATGSWQANKKQGHTRLNGLLTTTDIGKMLKQWGLNDSGIADSAGTLHFGLSWLDAPYNPSTANLSGTMELKLGPGRIVNLSKSTEAKLGLGRLLNLLSLQSIPRRLSLNFSDLFEKGYSFDSMKANFKLQNGNAFTDNLRLDGPVARVELSGRIGLHAHDYDVLLSITAYVTSSLPVAATIASSFNPLIGVATWVVDKVVTNEASGVTTHNYKITGSWENPVWQPVSSGMIKSKS